LSLILFFIPLALIYNPDNQLAGREVKDIH